MDISKLDLVSLSEEGYRCVIVNPKTGNPTDLAIIVKGSYANGYQDDADKADTIEKTAALLAKYTLGWENMEEHNVVIEFSVIEATRIYLKYPLIRGQVLKAASDVRNFIKD